MVGIFACLILFNVNIDIVYYVEGFFFIKTPKIFNKLKDKLSRNRNTPDSSNNQELPREEFPVNIPVQGEPTELPVGELPTE